MKKLEEIPKKEVFKVPEGYFENLPGIIQARVAQQNKVGGSQACFHLCPAICPPCHRFFCPGVILVYSAGTNANSRIHFGLHPDGRSGGLPG